MLLKKNLQGPTPNTLILLVSVEYVVLKNLPGDFNDQPFFKTIIIMNLLFLKFHMILLCSQEGELLLYQLGS